MKLKCHECPEMVYGLICAAKQCEVYLCAKCWQAHIDMHVLSKEELLEGFYDSCLQVYLPRLQEEGKLGF
jgi:hypothetical protein